MNTPTTDDLLLFFEIAKPEAMQSEKSKTSKPNLDKVDKIHRFMLMQMMASNAGMGTFLGVALKLTELVAAFILSTVDEADYDKVKADIGTQITILRDRVDSMSKQAATALQEENKAKLKSWSKAAQGAMHDEAQPESNDGDEASLEAASKLGDALKEALAPGKKKNNVH